LEDKTPSQGRSVGVDIGVLLGIDEPVPLERDALKRPGAA